MSVFIINYVVIVLIWCLVNGDIVTVLQEFGKFLKSDILIRTSDIVSEENQAQRKYTYVCVSTNRNNQIVIQQKYQAGITQHK